jgi:hypothetical protein
MSIREASSDSKPWFELRKRTQYTKTIYRGFVSPSPSYAAAIPGGRISSPTLQDPGRSTSEHLIKNVPYIPQKGDVIILSEKTCPLKLRCRHARRLRLRLICYLPSQSILSRLRSIYTLGKGAPFSKKKFSSFSHQKKVTHQREGVFLDSLRIR